MASPEQKIGNTVESSVPQIKISYQLTDRYGRVYSSGDTFDLGEIPKDATEFDGYIESPYGNFGYQGSLKLAMPILRKIKEHFEFSGKLPELISKLQEALREEHCAGDRYRRTDEKEPYFKAREKVLATQREIYRVEYELKDLNKDLALYRI